MAHRDPRKWDLLTPAYRRRLSNAGITREDYVSGRPLKAARGHARTPENRAEVARHPERFVDYTTGLDTLRQAAYRNLLREMGAGIQGGEIQRFDALEVQRFVNVANRDELQLMRTADVEFIQEMARSEANERVVFIDGVMQKINVWWYH